MHVHSDQYYYQYWYHYYYYYHDIIALTSVRAQSAIEHWAVDNGIPVQKALAWGLARRFIKPPLRHVGFAWGCNFSFMFQTYLKASWLSWMQPQWQVGSTIFKLSVSRYLIAWKTIQTSGSILHHDANLLCCLTMYKHMRISQYNDIYIYIYTCINIHIYLYTHIQIYKHHL